jgi:methylated-DNA-[protein]-cysteine S-methyltransferase
MDYFYAYQMPVGKIWIKESDNHIVMVKYYPPSDATEKETPLIRSAKEQLIEYFAGKRQAFELPLRMKGTAFQQKVWSELQNIPYGETISYKRLAQKTGNAKACRAVGMANNKNPVAIIVPCHRVIGSNGKLVGYAGGLTVKQSLLELEAAQQKG